MLQIDVPENNSFKNLLIKKQKEVSEQIKFLESTDPMMGEDIIEATDTGLAVWKSEAHENNQFIIEGLRQIVADIQKALKKLGAGTYGICDKCRQRIDIQRLAVMPMTQYCLSCK